MKTLIILAHLFIVSCASKNKEIPHTQSYVDADGAEVIELANPFQQTIMNEMSSTKKITPHTVYDSTEKFENLKKLKRAHLIERLSGPYRFHKVKAKDSLSSIALKIYGDRKKSVLIQSWNDDILTNESDLKAGMKLRYLPPAELAKIKNQKSNRLPASRK